MERGKIREVTKYIIQIPTDGDTKVDLLMGWARAVGVKVKASQRDKVRYSDATITQGAQ